MFPQFWHSVATAKEAVVVVEVVGGELFSSLDWHHSSAGKGEIILSIADGVRGAGMVEDGCDGVQSTDVNILVRIFSNNVSICVNYSWKYMSLYDSQGR